MLARSGCPASTEVVDLGRGALGGAVLAIRGGCRSKVSVIGVSVGLLGARLLTGRPLIGGVTSGGLFQAPAVVIWWRCSLVRLWVAISNRHSVRTADRPLR